MIDKSTGSVELLQGPARYSYNDLKVATENFSDEYKIGGGVFGEVFKVIIVLTLKLHISN